MLKYLLKEMRVHHYVKNLLVYAALACSGNFFDAEKLMPATLIFAAFCFTSSIVYMINDIKDVEKDRNHPTKCKRPIAAGNISISLAIFVCVVLFVVATVCCIASKSLMASFLLLLYLCLNVAYSMGLKNVPILDVSILVSGFLIRLICGAVAADIVVSNWLYLTVISLAFYLALGKRRNELKKTAGNTRSVLKKYPESFLDKNMYLFLALAIVFYALWSVDPVTIGFYGFFPKQMLGIVKYKLHLSSKEEMKEMYFSFLKGVRTDKTFVDDFWKQNQNKIKEWYLKQKRKDDVIISASPEFLLKPICDILGIDNLIATKVELSSGKFLSKNCQGAEKVVRFEEIFSEAEIEAFYSDSKSDTYMAKLATKAFLIKNNRIIDWEQG